MNIIELEDQNTLVDTCRYPNYAKFSFEKFNPVQSRIFEIYNHDSNVIIAAQTSAGKAQPDDSLVLTPKGYELISNLKINDEVIGSDGFSTKIIGIFPQGNKEVYKINFNDDTFTYCCIDHLWAVKNRYDKFRKNKFRVISTKDLIDNFKPNYWQIPLVNPVEFPKRDLSIDPYVLGILIGDGGIKTCVKISNKDEDVLEIFRNRLPPNVSMKKSNGSPHYKGCDYIITGEGHYNYLARCLDEMCLLGLGSDEKHIPYLYKFSSIDQRIELLRGLMDSDGHRVNGGSSEFSTTSRRLADDVAFLVRSLGGRTKVRKKEKNTYKYKQELRFGKASYRLTISLRNIIPFNCERKKENWNYQKKFFSKKISSIEKFGTKPCRCIKINNDDGLYITNDFIVTHNTICSEMLMAQEIRERGGKAMYLAPLRALAKEKIDDWTDSNHHFGDLNLSICTGDYRLTDKRKSELEKSNIVVMTSEMLNSRCRNYKSESNDWLKQIKTLIIDEAHLLTVSGRGDHLESGLMKFTQISPDCRIVALSATMPNVSQISEWIQKLNNKKTYLINSKYRPCPLSIHYEEYEDLGTYEMKEEAKIDKAIDIIREYKDDKFLVFVHSKNTGQKVKKYLDQLNIESEFHNADLEKDKRHEVEKRFKSGNLRVIVATSTLAWGINSPARRVIITGVHRGTTEVETYDIFQMAGRAGRVGYDPEGDVYILIPESKSDEQIERLSVPQNINSQLLSYVGDEDNPHYKTLAFHLVSEIHHGNVKTIDDIHNWYDRSLAKFQSLDLDDSIVDKTIELLVQVGAIKQTEDNFEATSIGKVSSMFYYSPFDVADLRRNFRILFMKGIQDDDFALSMALGNVDSIRMGFVTKNEKEEIEEYKNSVIKTIGDVYLDSSIKGGYAYFCLLRGLNPGAVSSISKSMQMDFDRTVSVLNALDSMAAKWNKRNYFNTLSLRIAYGVRKELVNLCKISNIGKVRAEKLYAAGFRNPSDLIGREMEVKKVLNMKDDKILEIIESAKNAN